MLHKTIIYIYNNNLPNIRETYTLLIFYNKENNIHSIIFCYLRKELTL